MIEIAITTCDRKEAYVHRMLKSMFDSDPKLAGLPKPRVVVDGPDASFLGPWKDDPRLVVETHSDPIDMPVHHRICRNTSRAVTSGETPFILFQDDIQFAKGWLARVLHTAEDIKKKGYNFAESYILTMWTHGQLWGATHQRFNPHIFHGNLALYMNVKARNKLSKYLREHGFDKYEYPDDVLVKRFASFGNAAIFATVPSLVQHVGKVSSAGNVFVEAQTFGRKW